ncbi:MAG: MATE family efflux transporter [Oscillospiraceae bacterium]|nr:MATE family efflux transporter [Oscillospiraceae bacterium]
MMAKNDFTKGKMSANILRMAAPMTLALLINVLYSIVDRIYIGHMPEGGTLALAGIGLAFPIIAVVSAFQNLWSSGGAPLCSIARGEGNEEKAELIMGNCYAMLLVTAAVLMAVCFAVKAPVLRLVGADDSTFAYANDYLTIYICGTVFVMTGLGMNSFINSQGFATIGMLTVLLGVVVNIALDPLFIFVFKMGVRGAALATIIAQCCSAAWVLRFLTGKRAILKLRLKNMRVRPEIIGRVMALGASGFTMAVTNSAVGMVNNAMLHQLGGSIYISVMTVINSMRELSFMPMMGINSGTQPVLSYNYGAKAYGRVRQGIKLISTYVVGYAVVIWIVMQLCPGFFIRIFNSDPELIAKGIPCIRIYYAMIFFMAFQSAGQSVFTALGKAKQAIFFSLLRKAILVIPLIIFLPRLFGLGVYGVFAAEPVSDVLGGLACFLTMYFTVWRKLPKEGNDTLGTH